MLKISEQGIEVGTIDLAIILIYLVGIVALGCWAGIRRTEAKGSDYFLAGKSLRWPVIGLAMFATNISTIHLVSFAQNGYTSGMTYGNFEWMAAFTLVILAVFFAPFYLRANVSTLPDFLERRYSRGSRDYLAVLSIFSAIAVHIGFSLLTGAIVLEGTVLGAFIEHPEQHRVWTIVGMCGATAIYTIVGGLLAVVLTESIQTIVLLVGSICITAIGFKMIGGWGQLAASVHPVNLTMVRPSVDPTGITWYAVFLGYPVLGIWYWCTDQTIVQRVLGAKDENHARIGPLFAGFIKILPVFLFVLPGIICLGLVDSGKIEALPKLADGSPNTEQTYTHMIKTLLSPGVRGVVIAAMLAALMSTVSGALNSIATLFSYDIYKRWKPDAEDRQLVWVGRMATFGAMCVAIVWTMGISTLGTTIFQAMVDVFPVVAPPTAVVFLWGVFWRRTSAKAAFWTLVGGSVLGMIVYTLHMLDSKEILDAQKISPYLESFLAINSLFMSFILFVVESVMIFGLSVAFPHQHTPESEALVWRSPWEALRGENAWRGLLDFRVLSVVLVLTMVGLYVYFSSPVTYYPVGGEVTLDGRPVVGALVYLDAEDDTFDVAVSTGIDGKYQYGTAGRAGGAPAGTQYRVRIVPDRDYLVRPETAEGAAEILAWMPAGAEVHEHLRDGKRLFVIQAEPDERTVQTDASQDVQIRRAAPIPDKYRQFNSSGLRFIVPARVTTRDFKLDATRPATSRKTPAPS
ncbi:MAG: hypothetical protein A2V98_04365 [Planctomycetes bacterium RBG_16_64_12]|nr:MAG: hypothetical protein A2V98_04365 [Planctomycetes bacterium RBG_16_64_12]